MKILFKNIKELVQVRTDEIHFVAGADMSVLPSIKEAYLLIKDGYIQDFGSMDNYPSDIDTEIVDATGRLILPTWCDSHTHLVYAGDRESEFVDKIEGLSYEEIAAKGGGILNSAELLNRTSEQQLFEESRARAIELIKMGSGSLEIKSGYGLTVEGELKMLRVIKRLAEELPIEIRATFLGAHAVPAKFERREYLKYIVDQMLPAVAKEQLANYIDLFCEKGYFSVEDAELLMEAGAKYGLIPKIHVNQFNSIGGVEAAIKNSALSVDHLEVLTDQDLIALVNSKVMPVALPGCSLFLGIPYTPARKLIDSGAPIALASDYNPGSAPSGNMNLVVSLASIKMGITPEEAINAATINGAYAMGLEHKVGSITVGKLANIILTKPINSYSSIPYNFGSNLIDKVYIKGCEYGI